MLKPLTVSPSARYSQLSLGKCLLLFVEYRAICIDPRTDFWSDDRQEYRQNVIVAGGVEVQVIPAKLSIEIDHQGQPTSFSS